jgi:hypothetical protein
MTILITAEYASLIQPFVSKDETRYYLQGFLVEPCASGGVLLVATDGNRMLVIRDEAGSCDAPEIVRLEKETIAACRPTKPGPARMLLLRNGKVASVTKRVEDYSFDDYLSNVKAFGEGQGAHAVVAQHPYCAIDGTFPDWRRVLPKEDTAPGLAAFSPRYIADFAALATRLRSSRVAAISIHSTGPAEPTFVRFDGCSHVVGILMPVRADDSLNRTAPKWLSATPPKTAPDSTEKAKPTTAKKAAKRKAA